MVNTGHYWSILVGVVDWNFYVVVTDIFGHVLVFIFKRKENKWNVSSLPRVLIISFNTLTLTFALQSRHLTLVFLAHLSLLRVSFWDTAMSVVRRTCGRP